MSISHFSLCGEEASGGELNIDPPTPCQQQAPSYELGLIWQKRARETVGHHTAPVVGNAAAARPDLDPQQ